MLYIWIISNFQKNPVKTINSFDNTLYSHVFMTTNEKYLDDLHQEDKELQK